MSPRRAIYPYGTRVRLRADAPHPLGVLERGSLGSFDAELVVPELATGVVIVDAASEHMPESFCIVELDDPKGWTSPLSEMWLERIGSLEEDDAAGLDPGIPSTGQEMRDEPE